MKKLSECLKIFFLGKNLKIMRISFFLLFACFFQVFAANNYAQNKKLTLSMDKATIAQVLQAIEDQSEFKFFYNNQLIDVTKKVDVDIRRKNIWGVLESVLPDAGITYRVVGKQVALFQQVPVSAKPAIQQQPVTGKVTDEDGNSLPGVNIVIKGTITGTITDLDGNFSIEVDDPEAVLVFTFIGMLTQEIKVGDQTEINITMARDLIGLEEVVAIGYGIKKKVNLTGSVGVITPEKLENRSVARLEQALQGQVTGLSVIQTDGQPGDESISMQIRGRSTFTSNPILTLVDGIPSLISQINPNDIESISVLKDASSTAIYGARAAGGVILITTKTGKKGKPQISYNSYVGIQQLTRLPEKVTAFEHATLFIEAELNDNPNTEVFTYTDEHLERYSSPEWEDHDRYDAIYSDALQTQHNISISGGSENQDYFLSMGYLYQDGIAINTGYEKYNFQYNQNIHLGEKLKLSFKGSFVPDERTAPSEANYPGGPPRGLTTLISRSYRWGNHVPIYTSKGDWAVTEGIAPTQVGINSKEGGQQILKRKRASGNFNLDYFITEDLKTSGMYGVNWGQNRQKDYSTKMKFYNPDDPDVVQIDVNQNALLVRNSSNIYQQAQFLLNYEKSIENHNFSALAGYTQEWSYQDNETVGRRDFITDNIYAISAGSSDPINWTTSGSMSDWALSSFISRVTYSYKSKYLAEVAMRYDGSSRFVEDVRWGFFPSFSAGWRITEENFLKDNNFLTYLKLRASWGQVGNQNVGNYPFASTLSTTNYYFNGLPQRAVYPSGSPNPELTWESKTGFNIGLDASIKDDLLSVTFDVFKERTSDILLTIPLPTTYGRGEPVQNAGIVENKGWELELAHRNSFSDFSYSISFHISDAINKVIDLKETGPWIIGNTITEEGHPMYEWYGWKAEGFFQSEEEVDNHSFQNPKTSPGDIKYQENGGDPNSITPEDRVKLGRSDPRFPYGVTVNLQYKNFDLTAFGQGVMSHKVFSNSWTAYNFDRAYSTLFKHHLDRWTPETPDARFPKTRIGGVNAQFSSFWLENAAYFRMKNIQVGYNIPQNVLSKFKIGRARIYLSAENLITITKLIGFDPEIPTGRSGRLVETRYPLSKVYNIGVNLTF